MTSMTERYDVVIIGAGHNGLACAAYLAGAGRRVLVLEAAAQAGGLGATREFAPGYRASVAHTVPQLTARLVQDLELERHGLAFAERAMATIALAEDGGHLRIQSDSVSGVDEKDKVAYGDYLALMRKFADAIEPFWHKRPPAIAQGSRGDLGTLAKFGWRLRRLGRDDMREMMRMIALPARDLMDEFFDNPLLKAALSWDANVGSKLAPRSPNNAILALLLRMSGDATEGLPLPRGGVGGLVDALENVACERGAELRTNSRVARILMDGRQAAGVELDSGERIAASAVVSNADPKTSFLKLLGARHLDVQFTHRINRLRNEGFVAKLHLALDSLPRFKGLEQPDGRMLLAPSMQFIENAFDRGKYGEYARELPMEILVPTVMDDSLAPAGKHVLSALVQYAPYAVKGGWAAHKEQFLANTLNTLERYAPNLRTQIVASELLTPADLEQQFRVAGGHWHHAEFAIDNWWMNRPTYGASQYRTPVPGFYLCGAGAHPGGGIMGAAGANAARAILEED
jgi:phytoene dehydrogenase-like protein